jgi:ABC-2 type transport system ATP-binding protein
VRVLPVLAAAALLLTGTPAVAADAGYTTRDVTVEVPGGPTFPGTVRLQTTLYLPRGGPAPAVIVSPGFGQNKGSVKADAVYLAEHGYVALAWTMRGFNPLSTASGRIALDAPDTEGADVQRLIDELAKNPAVLQDGPGDPRVGLMGESYGGGIALQAAALDKRVDAIVPIITWSSLQSALVPGGVFKAQYASVFFALGTAGGCRVFAQRVCDAYNRLAITGLETPGDKALLERTSADLARITAPTFLIQGLDDTLFPLSESLTTAKALQARGVPVHLAWLRGGHDKSFSSAKEGQIRSLARGWFDRYLRRSTASSGPAFRWDRSVGSSGSSAVLPVAAGSAVALTGKGGILTNPAGGRPASVSSIPGAGDLGGISSALGLELPGQSARWDSAPFAGSREILGGGSVRLHVTSTGDEAVLFVKVFDVAPDGSASLPGGQVAPVRLSGVGGAGRDVTLDLPVLAHVVPAGNHVRLVVSSTDLAYAGPLQPATYTVSGAALTLPLVPLSGAKGYAGLALTSGLIALGLLLVGLTILLRRRRRAPDLGSDDVPPVVITGLAKSYANGFRAVDGVDMVVERGQVLGLLGPNGAGKTTTLRMLAGLITPSEGEVRLFGRPVSRGAAVLARVGLFIEGPGLLPHLSGMENLRLYWTSTAPSMEGSYIEEALDIAGLGDAVERPVRTYSQGMRQRLAIAQAMLGRPDLLVLDEPTNGLDPPQIKEVREVLQRIAATGRTVLVSSHLLSEVEQTCSHVVVMSRGKVVAQGTVDDLLADDGSVRVEVGDVAAGLAVLRGLAGVESVTVDGNVLLAELSISRAAVVVALVDADVEVLGVASRRRLEDVFLELLGGSA